MLLLMFSIHDSCSGVYDRPFCARSEGEATRSFSDIALNADHTVGRHPEHFSLYYVGTFDDNTCLVDPCDPRYVAGAQDLVAQARNIPAGSLKEQFSYRSVDGRLTEEEFVEGRSALSVGNGEESSDAA